MEHLDPLSNRRCRLLHLGRDHISQWIIRIEQEADEIGPRQQFTDQPEALFNQPTAEKIHAGGVALGTVETRDKTGLHRIVFAAEDDRYRRRGSFGRKRRDRTRWRRDDDRRRTNSAANAGNRSN
jgi:hypothetical protein